MHVKEIQISRRRCPKPGCLVLEIDIKKKNVDQKYCYGEDPGTIEIGIISFLEKLKPLPLWNCLQAILPKTK